MMFRKAIPRRGLQARKARRRGLPRRETLGAIADGGKTNKNNNVTTTSAVPHKNPILCCINAKACMLFYRFVVSSSPPMHT